MKKVLSQLIDGFKFGILLQLAIGPVCIYIFTLGINNGFVEGFSGVLGVTLADIFYMLLAVLGISNFIKNEKLQKRFNILGAIIVILFGVQLVLGAFNFVFLPKFKFSGLTNSFFNGFFLTIANPMTILFWIGVFASKVKDLQGSLKNTAVFSIGSAFSTLFFLTLIAFAGTLTNNFINENLLKLLNSLVGITLIYFGMKKLKKAED